ncbi:MAG: hypothetical protein AABY86_16660 [Bdellovibrionota bacterium]
MRLSKALRDKLMDVRLRDKLVAEGKITKKELEEYLKTIPDETKSAAYTPVADFPASQRH